MSASEVYQSAPPARLGEFDGVYMPQEMLNCDLISLGLQEMRSWWSAERTAGE